MTIDEASSTWATPTRLGDVTASPPSFHGATRQVAACAARRWISAHLCQPDTEKMTVNQLSLHFLGRHKWEIKIALCAACTVSHTDTHRVRHNPCICLIHKHTCAHGDSLIRRSSHDHSGALTFSHACNLFTKVQTGRTDLSLFLPCKPLINSRADQNKATTKRAQTNTSIFMLRLAKWRPVLFFVFLFSNLILTMMGGRVNTCLWHLGEL